MATFLEFMRVASISHNDKTSGRRMREILHVMRRHHVLKGLTPQKAVAVLEELGPTYVKIGQLASNRSDLLPKEYCQAFEKLQDDADPLPFDQVLDCIDAAYGPERGWADVFAAIDPKPLGAASIAQVHRAVLLDGQVVAVKVRRPGVVEQMAEDVTLMRRALATARLTMSASYETVFINLETMLDVLARTAEDETNFTIELENLERFGSISEPWVGVMCPRAYPQVSTDAILVMEYVEGVPVDSRDALEARGYNVDALANRLVQNYITQVLDAGFFQADPHPGNIMLRGGEIVWIDLGMTGQLTPSERHLVGRMFKAVVANNAYDLMEAVAGISKRHGEVNYGQLLSLLQALLEKYGTADLADINLGEVFTELVEVLRTQNLILQPDVTMLVRGVCVLEGVLAQIAPQTNVLEVVSQHVLKQSFDVQHLEIRALDLVTSTIESAEALAKIPAKMSNTMDMLNRGELHMKGDVTVDEKALNAVYSSVGRLSLSMISMGLFLGSSILCTTNMQPRFLEVPVLGVLGYIGAFVLGVYVIVLTLKNRHNLKNNQHAD